MTTETLVKTCAHLERDSRGAKVQTPQGLECYRCWIARLPRAFVWTIPGSTDVRKDERAR